MVLNALRKESTEIIKHATQEICPLGIQLHPTLNFKRLPLHSTSEFNKLQYINLHFIFLKKVYACDSKSVVQEFCPIRFGEFNVTKTRHNCSIQSSDVESSSTWFR